MSEKIIVITGANGGLGRAMAGRFAADGDKVILLGRTLAKVEALAEEIGSGVRAFECVVSSPESVRQAFAVIGSEFGRIDALINNAARFTPSSLDQSSDALIIESVLSNLAGPMLCTREALHLLGRGGHVVNISSETVTVDLPLLSIYQATKAGLERFSSSIALELAERGIRVTVVRAGQMTGEGSAALDPALAMRLMQESMKRGFNLMERGMTSYASAAGVVRYVLDCPSDIELDKIEFHSRPAGKKVDPVN